MALPQSARPSSAKERRLQSASEVLDCACYGATVPPMMQVPAVRETLKRDYRCI